MFWKIIRSFLFLVASIISFSIWTMSAGHGEGGLHEFGYCKNIHTPHEYGGDFYTNTDERLWRMEENISAGNRSIQAFYARFWGVASIVFFACALPTYLIKKRKED